MRLEPSVKDENARPVMRMYTANYRIQVVSTELRRGTASLKLEEGAKLKSDRKPLEDWGEEMQRIEERNPILKKGDWRYLLSCHKFAILLENTNV